MSLLVVPAVFGLAIVFALLMTGSRARKVALLALAAPLLAAPFLLRSLPFFARFFLTAAVWPYLRLVDLALDRAPIPASRRVLHAIAIVEMRRSPRAPRAFDRAAFVRMALCSAIADGAFYAIATSGSTFVRYAAGVVASYAQFEAFASLLHVLLRAAGFAPQRLHDHPIKSRTIAEFWSDRWNRMTGGWLREHCFRPLARRGRPLLGVFAAFAASTLLHVYMAWAMFDARAALEWGAFFLLQIPFVLLERRLRVATWRPAAARAFTIALLLAASPLFVAPIVRAVDVVRAEWS